MEQSHWPVRTGAVPWLVWLICGQAFEPTSKAAKASIGLAGGSHSLSHGAKSLTPSDGMRLTSLGLAGTTRISLCSTRQEQLAACVCRPLLSALSTAGHRPQITASTIQSRTCDAPVGSRVTPTGGSLPAGPRAGCGGSMLDAHGQDPTTWRRCSTCTPPTSASIHRATFRPTSCHYWGVCRTWPLLRGPPADRDASSSAMHNEAVTATQKTAGDAISSMLHAGVVE